MRFLRLLVLPVLEAAAVVDLVPLVQVELGVRVESADVVGSHLGMRLRH